MGSGAPSAGKRRWPTRIGLCALVIGVAGAVVLLYHAYRRERAAVHATSCANHYLQIAFCLDRIAEAKPDLALPVTGDTREALQEIFSKGGETDHADPGWLHGYGSACPESFDRDGSIGYVYVGDGLRLGDVYKDHVLILFCPGENHRGYSEHCHAYCPAGPGPWCVRTNAEMAEVIREAIRRGESGGVPYSPRAMKVLRDELNKRLSPPP